MINTLVEVETLINTSTDIYLNNSFDSINLVDLMHYIKIGMEYAEKVTSDGAMKRNIVMQSICTSIDRFVKDEKTKSFMKTLVPQIISTIIEVSNQRWFLNMKRKYKSCCF